MFHERNLATASRPAWRLRQAKETICNPFQSQKLKKSTRARFPTSMAVVVADELKKDDGFCRSSPVIVSDENGKKLFEYGTS